MSTPRRLVKVAIVGANAVSKSLLAQIEASAPLAAAIGTRVAVTAVCAPSGAADALPLPPSTRKTTSLSALLEGAATTAE
jgi:hypothetical protein